MSAQGTSLAGDMGLIPGEGTKMPQARKQLSLRATTRVCAPQQNMQLRSDSSAPTQISAQMLLLLSLFQIITPHPSHALYTVLDFSLLHFSVNIRWSYVYACSGVVGYMGTWVCWQVYGFVDDRID